MSMDSTTAGQPGVPRCSEATTGSKAGARRATRTAPRAPKVRRPFPDMSFVTDTGHHRVRVLDNRDWFDVPRQAYGPGNITGMQAFAEFMGALKRHDYPGFATQQLLEREQAGLPPFTAQALVRAEARTQEVAQAFLNAASSAARSEMVQWEGWAAVLDQITLYPAVPMSIQRVANIERAQMLVESPSRAALQQFLTAWQAVLHATRQGPEGKGLIRWAVDVDPLAI